MLLIDTGNLTRRKEMRAHNLTTEAARIFVLAGKAIFTIRDSRKNEAIRFTYKISKKDGSESFNGKDIYFVSVRTGAGERDYTYLGYMQDNGKTWKADKKFRIGQKAASRLYFMSLRRVLFDNNPLFPELPEGVEIWHEAYCGRCGRQLTVPESIATGIGPDCAEKMGIEMVKFSAAQKADAIERPTDELDDYYKEFKQEEKEIKAEAILRNPSRHDIDDVVNAVEVLGRMPGAPVNSRRTDRTQSEVIKQKKMERKAAQQISSHITENIEAGLIEFKQPDITPEPAKTNKDFAAALQASEIWTKTVDGKGYCTEASDLKDSNNHCPSCGKRLVWNIIPHENFKDAEGDLTHQIFNHSCGTSLTVFND
jgi:hypothetical protein